jgi:hypothetical protein
MKIVLRQPRVMVRETQRTNRHSEMTVSTMPEQPAKDWAGSVRSYALVWGLPLTALTAGLFLDLPARTALWTVALAWMGTACLLNARRCARTHCRFTGPFYLAMIIPVLVLGSGIVPAGIFAWVALAAVVVVGSKAIWWATERAWGKFG